MKPLIDQDRIAARYAELLSQHPPRPVPSIGWPREVTSPAGELRWTTRQPAAAPGTLPPTMDELRAWVDDMLDDIRVWSRRIEQADMPGPRRLEAGDLALAAFASGAVMPRRGWPKDVTGTAGALAHLTGIPIVRNDDDLPPNAWRLVDAQTGEVLHEGTISPELIEDVRATATTWPDEEEIYQPPADKVRVAGYRTYDPLDRLDPSRRLFGVDVWPPTTT